MSPHLSARCASSAKAHDTTDRRCTGRLAVGNEGTRPKPNPSPNVRQCRKAVGRNTQTPAKQSGKSETDQSEILRAVRIRVRIACRSVRGLRPACRRILAGLRRLKAVAHRRPCAIAGRRRVRLRCGQPPGAGPWQRAGMVNCGDGTGVAARLIEQVQRNGPATGASLHEAAAGRAVIDRARANGFSVSGHSGRRSLRVCQWPGT